MSWRDEELVVRDIQGRYVFEGGCSGGLDSSKLGFFVSVSLSLRSNLEVVD